MGLSRLRTANARRKALGGALQLRPYLAHPVGTVPGKRSGGSGDPPLPEDLRWSTAV